MCLKCRYLCFELKASRLLELFRLVSMQNGVYSVESKSSCFMEAPIREKNKNKNKPFFKYLTNGERVKNKKKYAKVWCMYEWKLRLSLKKANQLSDRSITCLFIVDLKTTSMILKINLGQQFWRFHSFLKQKPVST